MAALAHPFPLPEAERKDASPRNDNAPSEGALSVVAVGALHALVALLRIEAQGRYRSRLEAAQADRLVGLLAEPVAAVLDP